MQNLSRHHSVWASVGSAQMSAFLSLCPSHLSCLTLIQALWFFSKFSIVVAKFLTLIQMLHILLPTPQGLIQVIHLGSNAASWCLHAWSISPRLRRIRCSISFLELPFFFMEVFPSILYIIWFIWFHSLVLHQDTSMVLSSWDTLDNQVINTHETTAVLKNTGRLECQWFAIFAVTLINQSRIKFVCVCL